MLRKVLLIEDDQIHLDATQKFIESKFSDVLKITGKAFNWPNPSRSYQKDVIVKFIRDKNDFDVLMIDMLLGGDNEANPLGLEVINEIKAEFLLKRIVAYTKIDGKQLIQLKNKLRDINVITKPSINNGVFDRLNSKILCDQSIKSDNSNCPENEACTNEVHFICQIKKYILE